MKYDALVIDTMNVFYRVSNHKTETASTVSSKKVYKQAICNFFKKIEELIEEHSYHDGDIYLLFDNPTSRIELNSAFMYAGRKEISEDYKANRTKESKEFYNSLGLIRYYYLLHQPNYRCLIASRLEADDLVKPLLRNDLSSKRVLLVSNDLDWAKEINQNVHWLKDWDNIIDSEQLSMSLEFHATEASLIAYKSIYGDTSDNIPNILSPKTFKQFQELSREIKDPLDLIDWANQTAYREKYSFLKLLKEEERQFRINIQLVDSIPVADSHLEHIISRGRDSEELRIIIEKAVGMREDPQEYIFGNVKRPRI